MAPSRPPPPPPPPCLPFCSKKPTRVTTLTQLKKASYSHHSYGSFPDSRNDLNYDIGRQDSYSPTATLNPKTVLAKSSVISEDSEPYDVPFPIKDPFPVKPKRGDPRKWGYGWGVGKRKEKEAEKYSAAIITKNDSGSSTSSAETLGRRTPLPGYPDRPNVSPQSFSRPNGSRLPTRPGVHGNNSSTLVGSALERKINDVEFAREKIDTGPRLKDLRKHVAKEDLDYYIIPSEDAHGSEHVAACDRRREWISGLTGTAGQVVISKTVAYFITDSRYWLQATNQIDSNWRCIQTGHVDGPKDWMEWLVDRAEDSRIGIDARMLSYSKATELRNLLSPKGSKLVHPPQNLVDLIWRDKPSRSKEPIFTCPMEFTGRSTLDKLADIRTWIRETLTVDKSHVATLITALDAIAYTLNLRGQDIPFNPVFQSYLMITLDKAILFIDPAKLTDDVEDYLEAVGVDTREYNDLWSYLRKREWGEGKFPKVIITPETSYAIALMLTHFRYIVMPSYVGSMKAIKNDTEIDGMRRAYLRDGASFVKFLAWLEDKFSEGCEITEYEAAFRLTEYRRTNRHFVGLAYENISASGPNAALPHYSPTKSTAAMIDRDTPYLNDSGGHYKDGTCGTARTWIFGRPTAEQCEAYTRVLRGHIAIDSAIFSEGTSSHQLGVLAREALWRDGMDDGHGIGYDAGSFLNIHEGPHSSGNVTLVPGHIIMNEPSFYLPGEWGIRIKSALAVQQVRTKHEFNGECWVGFERLTCVPIQTKMIKDGMLTKGEKQWVKDHNRRCLGKLEPCLRDDERALRWLKREV
ncbi:Creatinase aminopeptidase [Thelephora ganbajun]|uniref:Creatinase aminopeptidase n=1 Tax=Thelephora ganbajun TaxID=370292 RepID=A0ACB6Z6S1_THEGA|nr:Creatinase aminopeptidase [Thelephora ganbajun]